MADNQPMQTDGDEAKGQHGEEYEEIREQVRGCYAVNNDKGSAFCTCESQFCEAANPQSCVL